MLPHKALSIKPTSRLQIQAGTLVASCKCLRWSSLSSAQPHDCTETPDNIWTITLLSVQMSPPLFMMSLAKS